MIEAYKKQDGSVGWELLRNPTGVTTNAPALAQHLAYVRDLKVMASTEAARLAQQQQQQAGRGSSSKKSSNSSSEELLILPGHCSGPAGSIGASGSSTCDSSYRFATLALLKVCCLRRGVVCCVVLAGKRSTEGAAGETGQREGTCVCRGGGGVP